MGRNNYKPVFAIVAACIFLSVVPTCKQRKTNAYQAKSFVVEDGKMIRKCDFTESNIKNLTSYFESQIRLNSNRRKARLTQTYKHVGMAGWEYLFCLVAGKLIPGETEINLPADLLLSLFSDAGIIPDHAYRLIMQIINGNEGVRFVRLESPGANQYAVRLEIDLNTRLIDDPAISDFILNSLPKEVGGFFAHLKRLFIRRDVFPRDLSFADLPKDYVHKENAKLLNTQGGIEGVMISYKGNWLSTKTVVAIVHESISIDLHASVETFDDYEGLSSIKIGNISGIQFLSGEDPSSRNGNDFIRLGGDLSKVISSFEIFRQEFGFANTTPDWMSGHITSILDFSHLYSNNDQLFNPFDKKIITPILQSICELYVTSISPVFRDKFISAKDAIGFYNNRADTIVPLVDPLLGENPNPQTVRILIELIYKYIKDPNPPQYTANFDQDSQDSYYEKKITQEEMDEGYKQLGTYLFERLVALSPHYRELKIQLPKIRAADYLLFVRPLSK